MREILALAVVVLGILSYFWVATQHGLYQQWPIAHFLVVVVGIGIAGLAWRRRTSRTGKVLSGLSLAAALGLGGLFAWYTLDASAYDEDRGVAVGAAMGEDLAGATRLDWTGAPRPVWRSSDRATLLVFYRGHW